MANSANPEINKKIATSALGTLVIATVFFYLGDRYAETLVTYPGQIFDHLSDAFLSMWQTIKDAPFALDMTSNSLLFGGACFLIIWMIWLRYVAFIGNYRSGEESGSARWGTVKEGKKFKDLQTEDNNLLFTKNFGLALRRPKFDPEYDRNLNVLVVGGSGSGKTFNYVTPNICQLNTSYFVTDPKGTLLKDAGYLFTDNGYKLKSFNTINLDESMHYNPLKYVKTDTDILSFVNCFIMNTNPEGKSSGDPFWENAEKMLYTALIALLQDSVIEVFNHHRETAYVGASIAGTGKTVVGKCPRCGKDVIKTGSIYACSSIKNEKQEDGTWKEVAGCGFKLFGFCTKKFTEKQAASLLDGKAVSLRGCKSKAGKTFDCTVVLQKDGSVEPIFTPRKPTKKGRR